MFNPVSTYRLQFNKDFTFKDAEAILPYLNNLGIKTIYASPVLAAVKGSNHGYDVTNPHQINRELGTEEDFYNLINRVHDFEMGWIQDIVPNHMAYSTENPWVYDLLEKGRNSEYYEFFDIVDNHSEPILAEKLMLPFFGKPLEDLINDNELSIVLSPKGLSLKYFDEEYPLSVPAYSKVLTSAGSFTWPENVTEVFNQETIYTNFENIKTNLVHHYNNDPQFKEQLEKILLLINDNKESLLSIIDELHYYPCYWKDTETKINYRRFFTINGLICINIQNESVFNHCHKFIKQWIDEKWVDGLRIDHIDGLYNPTEYLGRLSEMVGENTIIYVE